MKNLLLWRWLTKFFKSDLHRDGVAFFRGVSIFRGLSSRQLGRLMQGMQKRTYQAGEVLFTEGQIGKAVFIIESGQVELTRSSVGGQPRRLGLLGPGQVFGEMALLEQMHRTATATIVEDGVVHLLYTATLEALIQHHPAIGVKILKNMASMLSALLRKTNIEIDKKLRAP